MPKTTPEYTVKNIVAIIVAMLIAIAMALFGFLGEPQRGKPGGGMAIVFVLLALWLGMYLIRGIRSRRR